MMGHVEEFLLGLFKLIGGIVIYGTVACILSYIILWLMVLCDYCVYKCRPEAVVQVCIIMLMFLFI